MTADEELQFVRTIDALHATNAILRDRIRTLEARLAERDIPPMPARPFDVTDFDHLPDRFRRAIEPPPLEPRRPWWQAMWRRG